MKYRLYNKDRTNFIEVEAETQEDAIRHINSQMECNRFNSGYPEAQVLNLKKYEIKYEYTKYHKAIRYATSEEEARKLFLEEHDWAQDEYEESDDRITSIEEIKE